MTGKVVLITGGNAGIGKATAIELARRAAGVVITSRDGGRGRRAVAEIRDESGNGDAEWLQLDLASCSSIRKAAEAFLDRFDRLDVLINNAGTILHERHETADGFEMTFGVNHIGHFLLTRLLLERLKRSAPARIINLTSTLHWIAMSGLDFDDLQAERSYDGLLAYARSKLANIHFTRELARRLDGSGITVNSLCPGLVATDYAGAVGTTGFIHLAAQIARPFSLTTAAGAHSPVYLASSPDVECVSGQHFVLGVRAPVSWAAVDPSPARRLWDITESLILHASTTRRSRQRRGS